MAGTYTLRLTGDDSELLANDELTVVVAAADGSMVLEQRVQNPLDDAEEAVFESIVHALSVKYDATFDRAQTQLGTRTTTNGISRQFAMHIYSHPGLRRVWAARCEYLRGVTGEDIPPCARVKNELNAILDGTADAPVGGVLSP